MNKSVRIQSPAKLILFGEHSVVYPGNKAVLVPIDLCMNVEVGQSEGDNIHFIESGDYKLEFKTEIESALVLLEKSRQIHRDFLSDSDISKMKKFTSSPMNYAKICIAIAYEYLAKSEVTLQSARIHVRPSKIVSGFGSSASFALGVVKGVLNYHEVFADKDVLFKLVFEAENFQHGNSSGADPAVISYNQPIIYKKPKEIRAMELGENTLNHFMSHISVFDTGKPKESTGEMISLVAQRYLEDKSWVDQKFERIDGIIGEFETLFLEKKLNEETIANLIDENGLLLEELGILSKRVVAFSERIRKSGFGVKIAGAGGITNGSGALIIYGDKENVLRCVNDEFPRVF